MNKNLIIGLVAGVVVVGAGAAYIVTSGGEDETNNNSQTTESTNNSQQESTDGQTFNPANTIEQDFVATFTTQSDGGEISATVNYDKDSSSWQYVTTTGDQDAEFIITADAYYSKLDGQWVKLPSSGDAATGFDTKQLELSDSEVTAFQERASYKGEASCPAGTCDLWEVENYEGAEKISFYLNKDTNTMSQLVTVANGATSTITYEYKDVTVEVPENAQTLPSLGQ